MRTGLVVCLVGLMLSCAAVGSGDDAQPAIAATARVLTGWGSGKPDEMVPAAAKAGFSELVVHHDNAAEFSRYIELGRQHGIDIYAWLYLGDVKAWKAAHPDIAPPMQVMNAEEDAALARINADKTPGKSNYQFGGEPVQAMEVLTTPLLCFHDPRVVAFFKSQIAEMLAFPGVRGVALDYIGYRNYRCCRCPLSMELAAAHHRSHPSLSADQAMDQFSLQSLVEFNNVLAAHARAVDPKTKVITHIYPLYLPEPLYGNRLDVDVCGQTAAWFFEPFWSSTKITEYARVIVEDANRFHPRPRGAALLGYMSKTNKTPDRVEAELLAIFAGGCHRVHICDFKSAVNQPDIAAILAKYFARPAP